MKNILQKKGLVFSGIVLTICLLCIGLFLQPALPGLDAYAAEEEIVEINGKNDFVRLAQESRSDSGRGKTYSLKCDLDFTRTEFGATEVAFEPFGSSDRYFEGTFLGNGHTVTLAFSTNGAAGIFAYTGSSATIDNLIVRGSMSGKDYVGGVVGNADGTKITRCVSEATVNGTNYVGGVAGCCTGTILSCVATGNVGGKQYFGGLCGSLKGGKATIRDGAFIGTVKVGTGASLFGGLVGSSSGVLCDTYFAGDFSGSIGSVAYGSLVGKLDSATGLSHNYAVSTKGVVGTNNTSGGPGENMKTVTLYEMLSQKVRFSDDSDFVVCDEEMGYGYLPCPSCVAASDVSQAFRRRLFSDGEGTADEPFVVGSKEDWYLFCDNSRLFGYADAYIEIADTLLLGIVSPASSTETPFCGTLLGNGNTLSYSIGTNTADAGLFAALDGAHIYEINLAGFVSTDKDRCGMLAGLVKGTTVIDSVRLVEGRTVTGAESVGGLIGKIDAEADCTITNCSVAADVKGQRGTGGFVGSNEGVLTLEDDFFSGSVSSDYVGGSGIGGFVGESTRSLMLDGVESSGETNAPYSTDVGGIIGTCGAITADGASVIGDVTGRKNVGGLIGRLTGEGEMTVAAQRGTVAGNNCLAAFVGAVGKDAVFTLKDAYASCRFVEDKSIVREGDFLVAVTANKVENGAASAEKVYYNGDLYQQASGGETAKNTVQLTDCDRTAFSQEEKWKQTSQTSGRGYYPVPLFVTDVEKYRVDYFGGGVGTESAPFEIATEQQLNNFAAIMNNYPTKTTGSVEAKNSFFVQTSDILLTKAFTPVSDFYGEYNGGNHTVDNLIIAGTGANVGLFATLHGRLENLVVSSGNVTASGTGNVASLVANNVGTVVKCGSSADVNTASERGGNNVGGLVGLNEGTVECSFFAAKVYGNVCVGGLVGKNVGNIYDSFTTGKVFGGLKTGGLVGENALGEIGVCQTNATIVAESGYVGGIAGINNEIQGEVSEQNGRIYACFSTAYILSGAATAGGLVGADLASRVIRGIIYIDATPIDGTCYYNADYAVVPAAYDGCEETAFRKKTSEIIDDGFSIYGFERLTGMNAKHDAEYSVRVTVAERWGRSFALAAETLRKASEMPFWKDDYSSDEEAGSEQNPYLIDKAFGLGILADAAVGYDFSDKYFSLSDDIDMQDGTLRNAFYPIGAYNPDGNANYSFNGIFDGNYHKIGNLTIEFNAYKVRLGRNDGDNRYIALFGYTGPDFLMKNLTLDDTCVISGDKYVASFVGFFRGRIEASRSQATLSGSENVGGFVGALASSDSAITRSVFDGALPDVSSAYGFVGMETNAALALVTDDSWFVTFDVSYDVALSYGRVLAIDAAEGSGAAVTVSFDAEEGFGFTFGANASYKPLVYFGSSLLSEPDGGTYRFPSVAQVKYTVRFCRKAEAEVVLSSAPTAVLTATMAHDYFYVGQAVQVVLSWQTDGYYLKNTVSVGDSEYAFSAETLTAGAGDEMAFSFVMPEISGEKLVVTFTVCPIDGSVMTISGVTDGGTSEYDGTEKAAVCTLGDDYSDWRQTVVCSDASGKTRPTMLGAGAYTVRALLMYPESTGIDVVIGKTELTYTIEPKQVSPKSSLDDYGFAEKVYDGYSSGNVTVDANAVLDGLCGSPEMTVAARITWAQANVGDAIDFTLDGFSLSGDDKDNYVFAPNASALYEGAGKITKKPVLVSVGEAEYDETLEKFVFRRQYAGEKPSDPADVYAETLVWTYEITGGEADARYPVGLYTASAAIADEDAAENYDLTFDKTYYLEITPRLVEAYTLLSGDLVYTGADLSSSLTAYFDGVGGDRNPMSVSLVYYVAANGTEEETLYLKGETAFYEGTEGMLYKRVNALQNAETYYIEGSAQNANYVLKAPIKSVSVKRATSAEELTFVLKKGDGTPILSGSSVLYGETVLFEPTDTLSTSAGYDGRYEIRFSSRPGGGDMAIETTDGKRFVRTVAAGRSMLFSVTATGATNFEDRTSQTFELSVDFVTLYVGIAEPVQTYGEKISYDPAYYEDVLCTREIDADTIDGLSAPHIDTGARMAEDAGVYDLFYGGGSSFGYVFDMTVRTKLTIEKRAVYVSSNGIGNAKTYGEADTEIKFLTFADGDCTEVMTLLPIGKEVEIEGYLSREKGENVGVYKITAGSIENPAYNKNYSVHFVDHGSLFVIRQRDIVLEVKPGQSKYYTEADQLIELSVSETATDGDGNHYSLAKDDLLTSFTLGAGAFVSVEREEGEDVGFYPYVVSIDAARMQKSNYNLLRVDVSDKYSILRAKPIIEYELDSSVYFGQTTAEIGVGTAHAFFNGREIPGKFSFVDKTISSMAPTTAVLTFAPKDDKNFGSTNLIVGITPQKKIVTLQVSGPTSFVYNGEKHQKFLTVTVSDTVSGGQYSLAYDRITGDNREVTKEGFDVHIDFSSDCYQASDDSPTVVHCTVVPAVVTVSASNGHIAMGDDFVPEFTYEGFVAGENESVLFKKANVVSLPTEPGTHTVLGAGAEAKNYIFRYFPGVLTIDSLSLESDGLLICGTFLPDSSASLTRVKDGSDAFDDLSQAMDKDLGANFFLPLATTMTDCYMISFGGAKPSTDGEYEYVIALTNAIEDGTILYIRKIDGALEKLTEYQLSDDGKEITFTSGVVSYLAAYKPKDTKTIVIGYLPLAGCCFAAFVLLVMISAIIYSKRHRAPTERFFAQRAQYKRYSNIKK